MGQLNDFILIMLIIAVWIVVNLLRPVAPAAVIEVSSANASTTPGPKTIKEIEKEIEGMVSMVTKMALPYFVRNSDLQLSPQCMSTFIKLFVDLRKLKLPAIKLMDAMAKPPYGLLGGTFAMMGDYDECLSVSATKKGDVPLTREQEYYHGQYCTIELNFPPLLLSAMKDYGLGKGNITDFGKFASFIKEFPAMNFADEYFKYHIGVCIPSTCTLADLKVVLGLVPVTFLPMDVKRCESRVEKLNITIDQAIFLAIFLFIAVLVVAGTVTDGFLYLKYSTYNGNHKNAVLKILIAFSLYNNTKNLLKSKKDSSSEIACVNGMYSLGTLLVVIYHTYFLPFFLLFARNGSNLGHYLKDPNFTLIVTMGISIDAYFLFSGLFLVYARFRRRDSNVRVNVIKIIVRRYLRLCPSLLLILGIIMLMPMFGSGPAWADIMDKAADNSRKWWWTYVLMFNNFLPIKDQNFLYLWFIPCLMQITIVGAILAWILSKSIKLGIYTIIAAGVICNVLLGVFTAYRSYPPSYAIYYFHNREQFEEPIYTSPLSHVFSYGIGMLLGYFMSRNPTLKWSRTHVTIGWVVSFLLTVGIQYVLYAGHDGRDVDPVLSSLYAATHKTLFCGGLSWIILACSHGYGGVVGKVLCWKGFGPLSKLGYFGYLVHYLVISYHVSVSRNPINYTHYENWMRICGYVTVTFLVAYVLHVTFEMPLNFLESLVMSGRPASKEKDHLSTVKNESTIMYDDVVVVNPNTDKPQTNGFSHRFVEVSGEHSKL